MKIVSWNVNGIRAVQKKGFLDYLYRESPDILCLQETKANEDQLDFEILNPRGYTTHWNSGIRPGYSGVAVFSKITPISIQRGFGVDRYDQEGRVLRLDYEQFILFNVYFPNGQKDEERLQFKLDFYEDFLSYCDSLRKKNKKLIICGDYNTAHKPIDLAHPKANENYSGFLPVERAWMDKLVAHDYVDTFRHFNPAPHQYSWWSYRMNARAKNVGWRIDYHFVSGDLVPELKGASIQAEVEGSDHCPVVLEIF